MHAFYFGDSAGPLFGIHHPPAGTVREHGVLLCPPVAQEHMRTHWALRQLAIQLSGAGLHVLRFDYTGVGDSAGDFVEATVDQWHDDIRTAAQELKDQAGVRTISIVGLRLGAALAATTAGLRAREFVLWDPVVAGSSYLAGLRGMHRKMLGDIDRFARPPVATEADGLLGFPFRPALCEQLEEIDLRSGVAIKAKRTLLAVSEERYEYSQARDAMAAEYRQVDDAGDWTDPHLFETALLPNEIVRAIATALGGRVPV